MPTAAEYLSGTTSKKRTATEYLRGTRKRTAAEYLNEQPGLESMPVDQRPNVGQDIQRLEEQLPKEAFIGDSRLGRFAPQPEPETRPITTRPSEVHAGLNELIDRTLGVPGIYGDEPQPSQFGIVNKYKETLPGLLHTEALRAGGRGLSFLATIAPEIIEGLIAPSEEMKRAEEGIPPEMVAPERVRRLATGAAQFMGEAGEQVGSAGRAVVELITGTPPLAADIEIRKRAVKDPENLPIALLPVGKLGKTKPRGLEAKVAETRPDLSQIKPKEKLAPFRREIDLAEVDLMAENRIKERGVPEQEVPQALREEKIRIVAEEHLKQSDAMKEAGVTPEEVAQLFPEPHKPTQLHPTPKPPVIPAQPRADKDFVLNNENIAKIRKSYAGFDELPPPQKKGVLKASEEAIKNRYDENAHAIAQEVNKKSRPLSDSEQAGMFLRMNEVEPIYQESINTWKTLRDEGKTEAARLEYARANKFRSEMDDITTALRYSGGTEAGRALAIRRNLKQETISEILFEAEELKGKRLSEPEAQKIETAFSEEKRLEKQLADMTAKYEAERAKSNEVIAKRVINQQLRGKRTTAKREEIKQNLSNIEKQLQDLGFRVNDITGASIEGLYLIGRYAGELAKLGELQFEGIVRQIKSKFPEFTDKDVIQGIVTKDPARQMKARAEATKRVAQLKQQARLILDIEKAEQGIFEPRKDRPTSPEPIRSLQDKLKELRKQAYRSGLDSGRLERALNLINQLDDQLKNQYRMVKDKQTIPAPELAEAKAKIAELRKQMRVEDALADLNEQFRTGDFKIKEKPQPKHIPEELERLQVQLKRQRRQRRDIVEELAPKTLKSYGLEAINTARTLKATADMSATLRQGLFPSIHLLRKGKFGDLAKTTGNAVKSFFSEYTADRIDNMIREMDNHYIRERAGLYLAERGTPKALRREEQFMSKVIDRIPVLKQITRASERHMTTTLNLLRVSMFDSFLKKFPNATTVELRAWADFVNAASGRGDIGGKIAGLNNIFFAPRFAASRFQTPFKAVKYWRHPRVRNEIVKDISASVGIGLAALEIAHLAGAEVGIDPQEADFGKIRIGDQRFDIWAGFQQPARLVAQIGKKAISRAEFIEDTQKDFDPVGAVGRFLGYKLSPAITIPNELLTGVTAVGQPTTVDETAIRSLIPIVYQEFYDEGINKETLLGTGVGFFGVGANLYEDPKSRVRRDIMKLLKSGETDKAKERAANWNKLNPKDRIVEFHNVVVDGDTTKVIRVAPKTPKRQR